MSLEWEGLKGQVYECVRCGKLIKGEQLITLNQIKCIECGYKVLKKVRSPLVKRVRAI
ncbi:MAG: DNA-directed RNA polymerase subunit P [Candidatus Bathyarchaeia archaeon]